MAPLQAALEGARQIGFTIVSITASLIAVFIPILFMGGIVGRLFREFAVTLEHRHRHVGAGVADGDARPWRRAAAPGVQAKPQTRIYRWSERIFEGLSRGYDRGITWVLNHAALMLLVTLATVG